MKLVVNNREFAIDADPKMPLLWALRDVIGLTGTNAGPRSLPINTFRENDLAIDDHGARRS
jgi:hypothetical protein